MLIFQPPVNFVFVIPKCCNRQFTNKMLFAKNSVNINILHFITIDSLFML
jgi:hypothetical protein